MQPAIFKYQLKNMTLFICPNKTMYDLYAGDEYLGRYYSPLAAADEVSTQTTGNYAIDLLPFSQVPASLDNWTAL